MSINNFIKFPIEIKKSFDIEIEKMAQMLEIKILLLVLN